MNTDMDLMPEEMTGGGAGACVSYLVCKSIIVTVTVILTLMVLRWIVVLLTAPRFPLLSSILHDASPSFLIGEMGKGKSHTVSEIAGTA